MNSLPVLRGRAAFIFQQSNFDIDRIIGFEAMRSHDVELMTSEAMREFDPEFQKNVRGGDFLVGGLNFGYGHPHSPPMSIMRGFGIAAVIAESFAPLYLFGETAAGFPQITCPGILNFVVRWDEISIDLEGSVVFNISRGLSLPFVPLSLSEKTTISYGGLLKKLKR